jgi:hypothetical protein
MGKLVRAIGIRTGKAGEVYGLVKPKRRAAKPLDDRRGHYSIGIGYWIHTILCRSGATFQLASTFQYPVIRTLLVY